MKGKIQTVDMGFVRSTNYGSMVFGDGGETGRHILHITNEEWRELGSPRMLRVAYTAVSAKTAWVKCGNCMGRGEYGLRTVKKCRDCKGSGKVRP